MANKHALLIGVDKYSLLAKKYQLAGCVNDARLMKRVLVDQFNFTENNIVELYDADATQKTVLAQMDHLVEVAEKDDVIVFHYSGHGSRRTTANVEKAGGKDGTIMPSDSGRKPEPNRDIVDDEIHEWLDRLTAKTENITLTFDCCHSGTITRDPFAETVRAVADDERSLDEMGVSPRLAVESSTREIGKSGWLAMNDRYVVISGCRDNEVSHEFTLEDNAKPIRNGALTHFLVGALTGAKPGSTYRDIFEIARLGVNTRFPNQHPQIEGRLDRELFGVKDIEPLRFIPVKEATTKSITLDGGAAQGLVSGANWAVYPQGTKAENQTSAIARITIDSVGPLSAQASIIDQTDQIQPGARCVEQAPSAAQFRIAIDVGQLNAEQRKALTSVVADSALISVVDHADAADLRVYVLQPRKSVQDNDPVPQLLSVASASWVVVNREGELAMPIHAENKNKVIELLRDNIETLARYQNALLLNNDQQQLDVEFNIYREEQNGSWQLANGGETQFESGNRIGFEIINHTSDSIFVSILDFDVTGEISLLYPPNKDGERVQAGQTFKFGMADRPVRLSMDDNAVETSGIETFKAFITTQAADFTWLRQQGTRSVFAGNSNLRAQFEAAFNGPNTRKAAIEGEAEEMEDWQTVNRSFVLSKRNI